MFIFKKNYQKKIKDLEQKLEKQLTNLTSANKKLKTDIKNLIKTNKDENLKLELLLNEEIKKNEELNTLLTDTVKQNEDLKKLLSDIDEKNKDLQGDFETKTSIKENLKPSISLDLNKSLNEFNEIKKFNKKQWNQILDFGTKNKIFNNRDKQKLKNIIIRLKIMEPLRPAQLKEGAELFKLAKEKDLDDFFVQFVDQSENVEEIGVQKKDKTNKIINFNDLINEGLKNGFIEYTTLEQINYDKEIEINDHFEAIEELEDRGIVIKY